MTDREQRIIAMRKAGYTIKQIHLEVRCRRTAVIDALTKHEARTGEFFPRLMGGRKPALSIAQRAEIRASDEKAEVLARLYNVHVETIYQIRRGQVLKKHALAMRQSPQP